MGHIFRTRVYYHPKAPRLFYHERDAKGWCADNAEDPSAVMGFDSTAEYDRWNELKAMERIGAIAELHRQVPFVIIPKSTETLQVGNKTLTVYAVQGYKFRTKADAVKFCRKGHIDSSLIQKFTTELPKFKEVVIEKEAIYTADFTYYLPDGTYVVEDCKSEYTRKEKDYILRRKLMLHIHGIKIYEYIAPSKAKKK